MKADAPKRALELDQVSLTFQVSRGLFAKSEPLHAVAGVDLTVAKGETVGLVGESGCGKSTLARILLGILKPSAGRVLVEGTPIDAISQKMLARILQPVFQDPYSSLNPARTVGSIIEHPLRIHGRANDARKKVVRYLDLVGFPSRLIDAYPAELSGGQRQRVAIARALILEPSILICDEPTSALDVSVQAQILNLLMQLRRDLGLTMLFISHNLAVVEHIADRVAVMYLGRIVEEGAARSVLNDPRHPYTRALLSSILPPTPGHGIPIPELGNAAANPLGTAYGCAFAPRCPKVFEQCLASEPKLSTKGQHRTCCHLA
jgi:peptide/nickel transport system ATP-binding protein